MTQREARQEMGLEPLHMDFAAAAKAERLRLKGNDLFEYVLVHSIQRPPQVVSRAPRVCLYVRDRVARAKPMVESLAQTTFSGCIHPLPLNIMRYHMRYQHISCISDKGVGTTSVVSQQSQDLLEDCPYSAGAVDG